MSVPVVIASLGLGLAASGSCLGICMPFFVPFVMAKDDSTKKGFFTALIFCGGRLIVYMSMGLLFFFVFSELLADVDEISEIKGFSYIPLILGVIIIIYAVWIIFRLPSVKVCPAKYAKSAVTLVLGMLIGSFICPPFIFMLVANIDRSLSTFIFSIMMFWVGSSLSFLFLGSVSGKLSKYLRKKKGRDWIRNVCSFILIFTGIWFIATTFINR